jgi:hypothetical protein
MRNAKSPRIEGVAFELALSARAAPDEGTFRREALAACGRLIPYDTAVFSERAHAGLTTVDVDAHALELIRHCERNFTRYLPDIGRALVVGARDGGFLDHDIYSAHERQNFPVFCEVVRPQRVRSSLMLTPRWRGQVLGFLRLERHGRMPFSRQDLDRALALLSTIELSVMALRQPRPATDPLPLPG